MLVILGDAGWGAGQLDQAMQQHAWLTLDPDLELIVSRLEKITTRNAPGELRSNEWLGQELKTGVQAKQGQRSAGGLRAQGALIRLCIASRNAEDGAIDKQGWSF